MSVTVKWKDNNYFETGHKIYKSSAYFTKDNLPSVLADLGPNVTEYVDSAGVSGENWYMVSALLNGYEVFSDPLIARNFNFGIGSDTFVGGDLTAGFLGEVASVDFITGDSLASSIGLTAGTSQNSDVPWWKFAIDNEILYVPTKNFRYWISWDNINAVNAVYDDVNTPVVTIGGYDFRVTLMTGAEADPTVNEDGIGSEWNRLIYRVHSDVPDGTGVNTGSSGGAQVGDNWASYNTDNTNISNGNGTFIWCQETKSSNKSNRVVRGLTSLSGFYTSSSSYANTEMGWRPVLRLIQ